MRGEEALVVAGMVAGEEEEEVAMGGAQGSDTKLNYETPTDCIDSGDRVQKGVTEAQRAWVRSYNCGDYR
jgi:hypothetical protein